MDSNNYPELEAYMAAKVLVEGYEARQTARQDAFRVEQSAARRAWAHKEVESDAYDAVLVNDFDGTFRHCRRPLRVLKVDYTDMVPPWHGHRLEWYALLSRVTELYQYSEEFASEPR